MEEILGGIKRWPLPCIKLKFIRTLKTFKQSMNTWTCQAEAKRSKLLELLEQKIHAKIVSQASDTCGKIKSIDNLYADSLSNLEKSHKNKF